MSASSISPPTGSTATAAASESEIDASCRAPLSTLLPGAAIWLVVASVFSLTASIKFHSPLFLAGRAWLTYGRVHAAASAAQVYGFALPVAFGVMLWILARLAQRPVNQPWMIAIGAKIWHCGVLVGIVGILAGDSPGFENLPMPLYSAVILFLAYLVIGLWTAMMLTNRRSPWLSPPQWFLIAALFWFPWIFSTANLLLLAFPVRGVMQSVIGWWFGNNLSFVWFGLVGIATFLYLIPRFAAGELHSDFLALFTFLTLLGFASWVGIPAGAPVPAWMPALSRVATVITLVVFISLGWNIYHSKHTSAPLGEPRVAAGFIYVGLGLFQLVGLLRIVGVIPAVQSILRFTWFGVGVAQLNLYGFFAMTLFGAVYYFGPRIAGVDFPWRKLPTWHFVCSVAGIAFLALPLVAGSVVQGRKLNDPGIDIIPLTQATLPFLRVSTVGELLILLGNLFFALNLFGLTTRFGLLHLPRAYETVTADLKTAEVKP
jgi:cytochrome c oxidase cbb3-type subunit 1